MDIYLPDKSIWYEGRWFPQYAQLEGLFVCLTVASPNPC